MSDEGRRIGVLGGSFDPIHMAHLIMAESVREALSLDTVLFVPVREQPLKQGRQVSPVEHRIAMVELAIEENPHFALSRVDVDRPGPSYTVDTLQQLRQKLGETEKVALWFIIGADSLVTLPRWRDPAGILAQARLAVVRRPGVTPDLTHLESLLPRLPAHIDWVDAPLMDISATDLRRRIADGLSIRYRVPGAVMEYIEREGLYK
ncbi:MAG TPA: nicotinate-nucleotide adenylyltransferase [Chloroflexia bacterium]|nr:nicotinate-nucleotide adenylyltransferase [Chloroflexia bacterium]